MAKATVVASRNLGLVQLFVSSMLCLQLCTSLQKDVSIYTIRVFRQFSFDIYMLSSDLNSIMNCDSILNRTYSVNERKCISDQELFSGIFCITICKQIEMFKFTISTILYRVQLSNHSYYAVHHSNSRYQYSRVCNQLCVTD